HLRGEKCRRRVRDRIMHVENIESFRFSDLRHFYRQRQGVIGAWEDSGVPDFDFVKMNSRQTEIEPDWFGVAEKMDVVTARRQLRPERRHEDGGGSGEGATDTTNVVQRLSP